MTTSDDPNGKTVYTVENFDALNDVVQEWAELIKTVEEIRNDDTLAPQCERLIAAANRPGLKKRNEDIIADKLGYEPGYTRRKGQS